jgi:hypothetical protein
MKFYYFLFACFILQGCFSSSMMQTAKPLEKGKTQVSVGVSGYAIGYNDYGIAPDFMYRKGINGKSDFGIGYSMGLLGHFRADYKQQLYVSPTKNKYLSSGVGIDVYYPSDFGGDQPVLGITAPLYFSINHNKNIVPYFAQRFTLGLNGLGIIRYFPNETPIENQEIYKTHNMFYTGSIGIRSGQKRVKYFLELSYSASFEHYFSNYYYSYMDTWEMKKGGRDHLNFQLTLGMMIGNKEK